MLNNILLRLLGISNTVIDGPTIQCEVSEHIYVIYYNNYRILRSYLFVFGTSTININ